MFHNKLTPKDFVGRGRMISRGTATPIVVHGTYDPFGPRPVLCAVMPTGKRKPFRQPSVSDEIEIRATSDDGESIRILGLEQVTTSGYGSKIVWRGTASYFIKGLLNTFRATGSKISCSMFIPATPLAISAAQYINSYDGTITFEQNSSRDSIKWKTPWGQAELIDNYDYVGEKVGIDRATIQIRRCQVHLEVKRKGKYALEKLLKELPTAFEDTFWLISFLSRKRVVWHSAEVVAISEGRSSEFRRAIAHRQSWLGFQDVQDEEPTWLDLLGSVCKI